MVIGGDEEALLKDHIHISKHIRKFEYEKIVHQVQLQSKIKTFKIEALMTLLLCFNSLYSASICKL